MEVTLKIEPGQVGETVLEVFQSLTPKSKRKLAMDIMEKWLSDPDQIETTAFEQKLLDDFRTKKRFPEYSHNKYDLNTKDDEIRRDGNYRKAMDEFKHSKAYMIESIRNEIVGYYKQEVTNKIKEDKTLKDTMDTIQATIMEGLPKLMVDATIAIFMGMITSYHTDNMMGNMKASQAEHMLQDIRQKLQI